MSLVSSANIMYGLWLGTVYSKAVFVKSMKPYTGEAQAQLHPFSTLALDGDHWSASCHNHSTPIEKVPNTLRTGVCVGPRASPDVKGKEKSLAPT
jgi:hypothetical protein